MFHTKNVLFPGLRLFEPFLTLCQVGNGTHFVGGKLIASGWTKMHLIVLVLQFCVGEVFHKFDIISG